ncbi:MAG: hypothetical protein ACRCWQ_07010 [Bacilli bacterium]
MKKTIASLFIFCSLFSALIVHASDDGVVPSVPKTEFEPKNILIQGHCQTKERNVWAIRNKSKQTIDVSYRPKNGTNYSMVEVHPNQTTLISTPSTQGDTATFLFENYTRDVTVRFKNGCTPLENNKSR